MKLYQSVGLGVLLALQTAGPYSFVQQATAQVAPAEQGMETLTHGPVHEAFAEVLSYDPKPGIIIDKAPPAMIEEIPPDQKPVGNNVAWIPGYWAWDDETNDFLWISGIWRNLPPSREWVPGYWSNVSNGYQWTSGYWRDETVTEVSYLPEPPATIESGPTVAASSDSDIWVPGNWMWYENRYAWRPGYWQVAHENWAWSPARYVWTPRGYIFVDGYWDYAVPRRGVLFAPVYYRNDYYARPGYYYTPTTVISLAIFTSHLFLRPDYGHYYFGDYYAPRYRDRGYWNWYDYGRNRRGYDPIYAYERWRHRGDRDWERNRIQQYEYFRDNENARPPRTLAALQALPDRADRERRRELIATSLNDYAKNPDGGQTFQQLSKERRDKIVEQRREMRSFEEDRRKREARADAATAKRTDVEKVNVGKSPIAGVAADRLSKRDAPPARPKPQKLQPAPATRERDETTRTGEDQRPRDLDRQPGRPRDEARTPDGETRVTPKERPRPEPTDESRVRPRDERRTQPSEERRVQPKEEQRVQPSEERRAQPREERRTEPQRPTPKPEPRVTPKERPQPEKQVERPTPKAEPRATPRAQPRPAPKAEPRPAQKAQPRQPQRSDSGKREKSDEEDKDKRRN